jgi:hypothetical protein
MLHCGAEYPCKNLNKQSYYYCHTLVKYVKFSCNAECTQNHVINIYRYQCMESIKSKKPRSDQKFHLCTWTQKPLPTTQLSVTKQKCTHGTKTSRLQKITREQSHFGHFLSSVTRSEAIIERACKTETRDAFFFVAAHVCVY